MIATDVLLKLVRAAVNELSTETDSFSDMVDDMLVSFIEMAAPMLAVEVLPAYMITSSITYVKEEAKNFFIRPDGRTAVRVPAPDDFCRFISFNAEGWHTPAGVLHSPLTSFYQSQYSSSPGIGSGSASPAVFLTSHFDGTELHNYIEAHSLEGPANCNLLYVPTPEVNSNQVNMDARLSGALAYYTASLYLQSINDPNGSKAAYDMAQNLIVKLNSISII